MNRCVSRLYAVITVLCVAIAGRAQGYSDDVRLVSDDGGSATVTVSATASKKKDAETLAVKSAFNSLMHNGIDGIHGGQPMVAEKRNDFDYRFFSEDYYINYITDGPKTVSTRNVAGKKRATVTLTIDLKGLRKHVLGNGLLLSPAWVDKRPEPPESAYNPVIVVVPYTDADDGYSFEAMRRRVENNDVERSAVESVAQAFQNKGYKTRDFITVLQNARNRRALRDGAQSDDASMVAQALSGDIEVRVGVTTETRGGKSRVSLHVTALEKQTAGRMATKVFESGYYHTTDTKRLVDAAVGKIEDDFFGQLSESFRKIVEKGREVQLDINLSESVDDWDFAGNAPVSGVYFKDALDEWLRDNAFGGIYDMSRSTGKYISCSVNVPLWDRDRNRSYTLSNFGSDLRGFFEKHLGDYYHADITALGQSIIVMIE